MMRFIPVVLGFIAIAACFAWQAQVVDRFGNSSINAAELATRFEKVPMVVGDWEGEDLEVPGEIRKRAGAVGHVNRLYTNKLTGDRVVLWLIVGHPRDIVRHTPDICYPSQGFRQLKEAVQHEMPSPTGVQAEFWNAAFNRESNRQSSTERCFWAWSVDGNWEAPKKPRFHFPGSYKAIFKMYFTVPESDATATAALSPANEFAKVFIPIVNPILFPESDGGDASAEPPAK